MINGLMEGGFGIFLLIRPEKAGQLLINSIPINYPLLFPRMYGLVALCLGILSIQLVVRPKESDFLPNCLLVFAIFHLGMFFIQYLDNPNWLQAGFLHIIFGSFFLFFYLKKLKTHSG